MKKCGPPGFQASSRDLSVTWTQSATLPSNKLHLEGQLQPGSIPDPPCQVQDSHLQNVCLHVRQRSNAHLWLFVAAFSLHHRCHFSDESGMMTETFHDNGRVMDNLIRTTHLHNRAFTGTTDPFHPVPKLFRVLNVCRKTAGHLVSQLGPLLSDISPRPHLQV